MGQCVYFEDHWLYCNIFYFIFIETSDLVVLFTLKKKKNGLACSIYVKFIIMLFAPCSPQSMNLLPYQIMEKYQGSLKQRCRSFWKLLKRLANQKIQEILILCVLMMCQMKVHCLFWGANCFSLFCPIVFSRFGHASDAFLVYYVSFFNYKVLNCLFFILEFFSFWVFSIFVIVIIPSS